MHVTVFYSWQTDSANAANRALIEDSLRAAAKAIHADESIQVEPVIERDTLGLPGAPNIASAILRKIEDCGVFVADVTIVNPDSEGRRMPNPNVLVELGYAIHCVGW